MCTLSGPSASALTNERNKGKVPSGFFIGFFVGKIKYLRPTYVPFFMKEVRLECLGGDALLRNHPSLDLILLENPIEIFPRDCSDCSEASG
ncbi:hypothetical protein AKJ16_DCAP13107 [Drosera capensis]